MTSRHCFFKIMKEDFRHKIWMLALSILGNLLAIPVAFLIYAGNDYMYYESSAQRALRAAGDTVGFFTVALCVTGGIIAIAGAFIVGLAGFRYVFHRSMVDTYHSVPVKRRTLFVASWLNGFLIWFVPFFVNLVITMFLGAIRLNRLKTAFFLASDKTPEMTEAIVNETTIWSILREGFLSAAALIVAFLLVYHLILAVVMLCGNVLNALALTGIAGVGAISLYALWVSFEGYYLDTFSTNLAFVQDKMAYASPLFSAVNTLYMRTREHYEEQGVGTLILVNLVIALLLGVAAAVFYEKRPSELAEQGVKNKPVRFIAQVATTLAAGMGGWIMLYAITADVSRENVACAWGVFGGLLAAVLVFGVMDIIFRMDFKAFFEHKALMAATSAGVLLICFGFCFDWIGYDTYLPQKEKIASVSVQAPRRNNWNSYETEDLERATFTDVDKAYDFLENAVAHYRDGETGEDTAGPQPFRSEFFHVKVTLNSGRSYYRRYRVYSYDNEAALKLLTSEEYIDAYYRLHESTAENTGTLRLRRNGRDATLQKGQDIREEEIRKICDAFNRDIEEHPEVMIQGGGRVLALIVLGNSDYQSDNRYLIVYEDMTHTREALRECGFGFFADPIAAEEVEEIRISTNMWASELEETGVDLIEYVREQYMVEGTEGTAEEGSPEADTKIPAASEQKASVAYLTEAEDEPVYVSVTDAAEIEELLELVSYHSGTNDSGAFQKELVGRLTIITKSGDKTDTFVYEGTLPEKYILRFQR